MHISAKKYQKGENRPNENFPKKLGSFTSVPLWTPNFMGNTRKKLMDQFSEKCVTDKWTNGQMEGQKNGQT